MRLRESAIAKMPSVAQTTATTMRTTRRVCVESDASDLVVLALVPSVDEEGDGLGVTSLLESGNGLSDVVGLLFGWLLAWCRSEISLSSEGVVVGPGASLAAELVVL